MVWCPCHRMLSVTVRTSFVSCARTPARQQSNVKSSCFFGKVTGRPPRPNTALTRKKPRSKEGNFRGSSSEVTSDDGSVSANRRRSSNPCKSSLKKCNSEGSIPKSVENCGEENFAGKKSVSFSREVMCDSGFGAIKGGESREGTKTENVSAPAAVPPVSGGTSDGPPRGPGIVIKDGLEVKPENVAGVENGAEAENKPRRTAVQSDRAKLLAQVRAATRCACVAEECACRGITRPTMGVISDAKAARTGLAPGLRLLVRFLGI